MIQIKKLLLPLVLAVTVQGASLAQNELVLKEHHHLLRGEVVSSTADSVTFKHMVGDTSETQTYAVAAIDPHSFYIIRKHAVGDDAAAKVELGKYCEANGLYTRARNQYIEAKKLDKSLDVKAQMATARQGTAKDLMAEAQAAADKGHDSDAFRYAAAVVRRFPTTPTADDARALCKAMHTKIVAARETVESASAERHGDEHISNLQTEINRASDENARALQEKSLSGSQRGFEQSIKTYMAALAKLEAQAKKYTGSDAGNVEVTGIVEKTKSDLIDTYINLGSIYLTQTNFQHALKEANAALAVDSNNPSAKSFRARVATSSADTGVEVYGRRGVVRRR